MIKNPDSMRRERLLAPLPSLLAITLLLTGCSTSTEPENTYWEGTLLPVLPSAVTGVAAAVTQFGRTDASVEIREAEVGVLYGWRIDSGTCEAQGLIQGGIAAYPLIEPDESGIGSGNAVLSSVFISGGPYAARVYLPINGGGQEVVACGKLEEVS